jgi:flagellar motor component MotA
MNFKALLGVVLMLAAVNAEAYIGPGAGLGVLGAIFGAIMAVVLAVLGVFWYPIKRLLNRRKQGD